MAMRYEKLKNYAPSLLPRDMDISLDAEIEEQRELEDPGLTRLLAGVGLIPADTQAQGISEIPANTLSDNISGVMQTTEGFSDERHGQATS